MLEIEMVGVTEYCENIPVYLTDTTGIYEYLVDKSEWAGNGRLVIKAINEGGYNSTQIDVLELIQWLKDNRPDLLA